MMMFEGTRTDDTSSCSNTPVCGPSGLSYAQPQTNQRVVFSQLVAGMLVRDERDMRGIMTRYRPVQEICPGARSVESIQTRVRRCSSFLKMSAPIAPKVIRDVEHNVIGHV